MKKQKKLSIRVLSVFMTGVFSLGLVACDSDKKNSDENGQTSQEQGVGQSGGGNEHSHTYSLVVTDPTCTTKGYTTYTCDCGSSYVDSYVSELGHDFTDFVSNEDATCEKDGTETATCNRANCNAKKTQKEQNSATGHHWDEGGITGQKTCEGSIEAVYTCQNCAATYTATVEISEYTANEVFQKTQSSVGEIITYDKSGAEYALGTGFVYGSDGKIITNYHVIEKCYSAKITIDGATYTIEQVLAYDKEIDIAVLKIQQTNMPSVSICEKSHAVGSKVYAFGSSRGLTATFSQGIITYADREIDGVHYVQHDAAISNGNSGGPLINGYGEVIGINTMTIRDSQNLNFAISIKELNNLTFGVPVTLAELYEIECDVFSKLKNYIVANGTYDSSDNEYFYNFGTGYSSDYTSSYSRSATYNVTDNEIDISLLYTYNGNSYFVMITIDSSVDGVYDWGYIDDFDYCMLGTIYASTYTENSLLGYSYNNISYSSIRSSIRELASVMVDLLLTYLRVDLAATGTTPADFGFLYY